MTAKVITEQELYKAFEKETNALFREPFNLRLEGEGLSVKHFNRLIQTFPPCWKPEMTSIKLKILPFGIIKCYMCVVFLEQSTSDYFVGDLTANIDSENILTLSLKK